MNLSPLRILVHGASGRMGRALLRLAPERSDLVLVAAATRAGAPLPEAPGLPVLATSALDAAPV
ncbi:MAG: 4-hydroxy-tetrahydrodipicolinate reductase, partial [Arenimonas sp.]|nr:4-hydroxy-tetrahydrodipicolinate reductase [Arenimonas sp.]